MTFESADIIKTMLENDGTYPGDPQMARIYSYENGPNKVFAVFAHPALDDMHASIYVRNPILLFNMDTGLTAAGKEWLKTHGSNIT